jgi:hypothetical protein
MTSGNMIIENHQSEHSLLSPRRVFAHCLQKNNNILTTILMISSTINKRGILPNDTRSVRKVSDRIFFFDYLMDYNLARLHEPTLNLSAHA